MTENLGWSKFTDTTEIKFETPQGIVTNVWNLGSHSIFQFSQYTCYTVYICCIKHEKLHLLGDCSNKMYSK